MKITISKKRLVWNKLQQRGGGGVRLISRHQGGGSRKMTFDHMGREGSKMAKKSDDVISEQPLSSGCVLSTISLNGALNINFNLIVVATGGKFRVRFSWCRGYLPFSIRFSL